MPVYARFLPNTLHAMDNIDGWTISPLPKPLWALLADEKRRKVNAMIGLA